jgi:hypothetical protein
MNDCVFKVLKAKIPAGRMSGEMNTSLGNGFANLMLFLFLSKENGNEVVDCLVEGDDLVGGFEGRAPTAMQYASLGFTIKIKIIERLSDASFCGLVFDEEDLVSIADPIKILLNIGWTTTNYRTATMKIRLGLLRAKAFSQLASYAGVPIVQAMAVAIIRLTAGKRLRIPTDWNNYKRRWFTTHVQPKEIGLRTRFLMERVFDISMEDQRVIEEYFDRLNELKPIDCPAVLAHCTDVHFEYNRRFVSNLPLRGNVFAINQSEAYDRLAVTQIMANQSTTILYDSSFLLNC